MFDDVVTLQMAQLNGGVALSPSIITVSRMPSKIGLTLLDWGGGQNGPPEGFW